MLFIYTERDSEKEYAIIRDGGAEVPPPSCWKETNALHLHRTRL
nr:MAG TPA: hypothetical protein [Caudoviricetes sp.]